MIYYILALLSALIVIYFIIKAIPYTPAIDGENAIASIEKVRIGNIEQGILIRSRDIKNPILLYLHSGPGSSEMVSFRSLHSKLGSVKLDTPFFSQNLYFSRIIIFYI